MEEAGNELIDNINSLGLPVWFLICVAALYALHRTGVLAGLGEVINQIVHTRQSMQSRLIDKTLDQNGTVINVITDRLLDDIDKLGERLGRIEGQLNRIDTKFQFVIGEVEYYNRSKSEQHDNFSLISGLQERIANLEARQDVKPVLDNSEMG